jgi:hypothetical protein
MWRPKPPHSDGHTGSGYVRRASSHARAHFLDDVLVRPAGSSTRFHHNGATRFYAIGGFAAAAAKNHNPARCWKIWREERSMHSFGGGSHTPSELFRQDRNQPPGPSVRLAKVLRFAQLSTHCRHIPRCASGPHRWPSDIHLYGQFRWSRLHPELSWWKPDTSKSRCGQFVRLDLSLGSCRPRHVSSD